MYPKVITVHLTRPFSRHYGTRLWKWEAKLYEARPRKADGVFTWRFVRVIKEGEMMHNSRDSCFEWGAREAQALADGLGVRLDLESRLIHNLPARLTPLEQLVTAAA